jgi:hypothetical protein
VPRTAGGQLPQDPAEGPRPVAAPRPHEPRRAAPSWHPRENFGRQAHQEYSDHMSTLKAARAASMSSATLREALDLRGSRDFEHVATYQAFLAEIIGRRNARRRAEVALELAEMKALPKFKTTDFTLVSTTVTSSGTIRVRGVLYTMPSRLVGTRLEVHIYDDRLVCFLGATEVLRRGASIAAAHPVSQRGQAAAVAEVCRPAGCGAHWLRL